MKRILGIFAILIFILINGGCGGGVLGETGIATYSDPLDQQISDGWNIYNSGNYRSAKERFSELIKREDLTAKQLANAYTGLGFSVAKDEGVLESIRYFERGQEYNNDAKVGLAAYYLSLGDKRQFYKGILALESIGIQGSKMVYRSDFNKELTTERVKTLLGLLYYYSGRYNDAFEQFRMVKELNEPKPDEVLKNITDSFIR